MKEVAVHTEGRMVSAPIEPSDHAELMVRYTVYHIYIIPGIYISYEVYGIYLV